MQRVVDDTRSREKVLEFSSKSMKVLVAFLLMYLIDCVSPPIICVSLAAARGTALIFRSLVMS